MRIPRSRLLAGGVVERVPKRAEVRVAIGAESGKTRLQEAVVDAGLTENETHVSFCVSRAEDQVNT
jgi:hypothetical protein